MTPATVHAVDSAIAERALSFVTSLDCAGLEVVDPVAQLVNEEDRRLAHSLAECSSPRSFKRAARRPLTHEQTSSRWKFHISVHFIDRNIHRRRLAKQVRMDSCARVTEAGPTLQGTTQAARKRRGVVKRRYKMQTNWSPCGNSSCGPSPSKDTHTHLQERTVPLRTRHFSLLPQLLPAYFSHSHRKPERCPRRGRHYVTAHTDQAGLANFANDKYIRDIPSSSK
jgi:hypothetical protein